MGSGWIVGEGAHGGADGQHTGCSALCQFSYTGTATDKPLMDWLEHYTFPSEARLGADLHEAREVYAGVVHQTLRQGTTTAMYFATVHQVRCSMLPCAAALGPPRGGGSSYLAECGLLFTANLPPI